MNSKPPPTRHKFHSQWDEIVYLYDKLLYWLYQRNASQKARPYAERLEYLLSAADPKHEAILGEECWSLLNEAKGNFHAAIRYRINEIRLIRKLRRVSRGKPFERFALNSYGIEDLSDRLDLLAILYHDAGDLQKAIRTLQESKQICAENSINFDGGELLEDYLQEQAHVGLARPLARRRSG
jgi:tetratricopeptide (TPR) repeat protein